MCTPLPPVDRRPQLVLAYADSRYAAQCSRHLRRRGWRVHLTASGTAARRLARQLPTAAVVLEVDLAEESGWLTCAKLLQELPQRRVLLVSASITAAQRRLAAAVGAEALLPRSGGAAVLLQQLATAPLAAAG
jgi:ActR/RegA family two-component response regulator